MTDYNIDLCNERHDSIERSLLDIKNSLKELKDGQLNIHHRLFVDNGVESHQSKINRMDRWIKGVCIAVATLVIPVVLMLIETIIDKFAG